MIDHETVLRFCKYAGLGVGVVATILAVWASAEGRSLTRREWSLIGLAAIAGVVALIAAASEDVAERRAQERAVEKEAQVAREEATRQARRTREIVVSGQQLRSLKFEWVFQRVPQEVVDGLARGAAEAERVYQTSEGMGWQMARDDSLPWVRPVLDRWYRVYPWIASIGHRRWFSDEEDSVMLIGLDESPSAVLPLGVVIADAGATITRPDFEKFLEEQGPGMLGASRKRHVEPDVSVVAEAGRVSLCWHLTPSDLHNAMDLEDPALRPTAYPRRFRILVLAGLEYAPFDRTNVTQWHDVDDRVGSNRILPWRTPGSPEPDVLGPSEITLTANNLHDFPVRYSIEFLSTHDVTEKLAGMRRQLCFAAVYEVTRAPAAE